MGNSRPTLRLRVDKDRKILEITENGIVKAYRCASGMIIEPIDEDSSYTLLSTEILKTHEATTLLLLTRIWYRCINVYALPSDDIEPPDTLDEFLASLSGSVKQGVFSCDIAFYHVKEETLYRETVEAPLFSECKVVMTPDPRAVLWSENGQWVIPADKEMTKHLLRLAYPSLREFNWEQLGFQSVTEKEVYLSNHGLRV